MTRKSCNCEFCIACDVCNHSADSHVAGDGNCMMKGCDCQSHKSWVMDLWDKMTINQKKEFDSFLEFADAIIDMRDAVLKDVNVFLIIVDSDSPNLIH